jgi:hypothetical protein
MNRCLALGFMLLIACGDTTYEAPDAHVEPNADGTADATWQLVDDGLAVWYGEIQTGDEICWQPAQTAMSSLVLACRSRS